MANRREIVRRRQAVRNIRKITRTMQLVATARYQSAYNRAVATKPYSEKLGQMAANLSRAAGSIDHPLMRQPDDPGKGVAIVISSSRGLAGSYNTNLLRRAMGHLDELAESRRDIETRMMRKKGAAYFRYNERAMDHIDLEMPDMPAFADVEPMANELIQRFTSGDIDSADIVYTHFYSTSKQAPEVLSLLPLTADGGGEQGNVEYEFSPDPEELLAELLPATVRLKLYQAFTDAAISEQLARMVAMKAATTAAEDKIKLLTREYNRARQTAITMELLDIVGGANALA